jgi:hypothetical protein
VRDTVVLIERLRGAKKQSLEVQKESEKRRLN